MERETSETQDWFSDLPDALGEKDDDNLHGWPRSAIAVQQTKMMNENRRSNFNDPGHAHFLTFSCFRRCQLLTDAHTCGLLAKALNRGRDRHDFDLWAYVFMPDHVHLLIRPRREKYSIGGILRSIKGPFAKWLNADWEKHHPIRLKRLEVKTHSRVIHRVWQRGGGYDRNLFTYDLICRAIEYIEFNPVRKGMVTDPEDWRWSSARRRTRIEDVPLRVDTIERAVIGG